MLSPGEAAVGRRWRAALRGVSPVETTKPTAVAATGPPGLPEPVLALPAYSSEPVEFERVVPTSGNLAVAGKQFWLGPPRQKIALGRAQAGRIVTVHVAEHTLTIETEGGPRTVTRTTTRPIRNLKANRPWSRKTSNVS